MDKRRTKTLVVPETEWFTPSTHPKMTVDELRAWARTTAWAAKDGTGDPVFVMLRCPCCGIGHTPDEILEHVEEDDPTCDRQAWGRDDSSSLVAILD